MVYKRFTAADDCDRHVPIEHCLQLLSHIRILRRHSRLSSVAYIASRKVLDTLAALRLRCLRRSRSIHAGHLVCDSSSLAYFTGWKHSIQHVAERGFSPMAHRKYLVYQYPALQMADLQPPIDSLLNCHRCSLYRKRYVSHHGSRQDNDSRAAGFYAVWVGNRGSSESIGSSNLKSDDCVRATETCHRPFTRSLS